jgi:hypothetical protein
VARLSEVSQLHNTLHVKAPSRHVGLIRFATGKEKKRERIKSGLGHSAGAYFCETVGPFHCTSESSLALDDLTRETACRGKFARVR